MPLWLLGAFGTIKRAASSAFTWAAASTTHLLMVALAITAALGLYEHHEATKYHKAADQCSAARKTDHEAYVKAQQDALAKAVAAKAATEKKYADLAERTDADAKLAHDAAMADAERYIALHRVRNQAAASQTGGAATAAEDHGAPSGNNSGSAPVVDEVTVNADDVRICTTNTTRLEAVRQWATELAKP